MISSKIFLFAILGIFASCSSTEEKQESPAVVDLSVDEFPQEWKLVLMSTMLVGSETTGEDMYYQENLIFTADETFTKTRIKNGTTIKATGTFTKDLQGSENFYILKYTHESEIIDNCNGSKEEYLYILSNSVLTGTANACDHPSKKYERIK